MKLNIFPSPTLNVKLNNIKVNKYLFEKHKGGNYHKEVHTLRIRSTVILFLR